MEKHILNKIEELREEMVDLGSKYGLNHPKVIEISRKIDKLHNQLNEMQNELKYAQLKKIKNNKLYEWEYTIRYA